MPNSSSPIIRVVDTGGDGLRILDYADDRTKSRPVPLQQVPIEYKGTFTTIEQWIELIRCVEGRTANTILFATAGVIKDNAVVVEWPNGHWLDGTDLRQICIDELDADTYVFNDMEAAATGMALLTNEPHFVGATFSSGWGARVFVNREMVDPETEFGGHMTIDSSPSAKICTCSTPGKIKRGHFEGIYAGRAMREDIHKLSNRANMPVPAGIDPGEYLDRCYDENVPWAKDYYIFWARGIGLWLANVLSAFPVQALVYKGSQGMNMIPRALQDIRSFTKETIIGGLEYRADELRYIPSPGFKNEDTFRGLLWLGLRR